VCSTFFVYAPGAWLPAFFIRVHGLTTAQVGRLAALAVGGGGVFGTVGAGILCDGLRVRIPDPEAKILLGALILGLPALLVTLLVADRSVALAGMFFLNICAFAYLGPIVTLIQRQATEQTRALAIAIAISTSNIFNLTVVLPLVGLLSDSLRCTQGVDAIRYALAIAGVLMAPMGMLAYWRIRGADVGIPCSSSGQLGM
jgi:hypothetical protein